MEDPTKTPEPTLYRKHVKDLVPECDNEMEKKAKEFGYNERYARIIGESRELVRERHKAVAYDTNKTRRTMVKPTVKGTYK